MFDIASDVSVGRSAPLTVGNNSQNTALVDMQGYSALSAYAIAQTITAAGAGVAFKLQHSDSTVAGTFVDVPAGLFEGTITAIALDTDDDRIQAGVIRYLGKLRYVRLVMTGGASTNGVLFALFVRGKPTVVAPVPPTFTLTAAT